MCIRDSLYQRLVKAGTPTGLVAVRYGVLAWLAALLAGSVARSVGALAATCFGVAALGLHLFDGARRTAGVPRSLRP